MQQLLHNAKFTLVSTGAVDGTGNVDTSIVDMSGFEGIAFLVQTADTDNGSTLSLTLQHSDTNDSGAMASTATTPGSGTFSTLCDATSGDNIGLLLDCHRPTKRYVRLRVGRADQASTIEKIWAIQYGASKQPVTQGTGILQTAFLAGPLSA